MKENNNFCRNCNKPLKLKIRKYCNSDCQHIYQWKKWCCTVEKNNVFPEQSFGRCRRAKRFLIERRGHQCEICKRKTWQGNPIPLILDHENGDASNWKISNCRLVCPNCDHQLPTFAGRNIGKSPRKYRRTIYLTNKNKYGNNNRVYS